MKVKRFPKSVRMTTKAFTVPQMLTDHSKVIASNKSAERVFALCAFISTYLQVEVRGFPTRWYVSPGIYR